jgi:lipocalin
LGKKKQNNKIIFQLNLKKTFKVIDTDYSTYSLVYACGVTLGLFETEYAWILSRQPTLDQKIIDSLKNKFDSYGIDSSQFKPHDQTCGK